MPSRVLLLQTGLLQCEQQTSAAIMRALECISLCNEHHLYMLATKAKLLLAKSQVCMCALTVAFALTTGPLLVVHFIHGSM